MDKNKKLIGLVTDYDIRKAFAKRKLISELSIKDIMTPHPITIYSDEKAIMSFRIMKLRKKPLTVLPVINRTGHSVGIIHLQDLVNKGLVSVLNSG